MQPKTAPGIPIGRRMVAFAVASLMLLAGVLASPLQAQEAAPSQIKKMRELVRELYDLQDPAFNTTWPVQNTLRMGHIVEEMQALNKAGVVLKKNDPALRILNNLVDNMHSHSRVLAAADVPNVAYLRVGKTPLNPEFGGILSDKASDMDITAVGPDANRARDLRLQLLDELYGEKFAKTTMTNIALGDATITASRAGDIRDAFATAMMDPENHRTYSGLSFVEGYISEVAVSDANGHLTVRRLEDFDAPTPEARRKLMFAWANEHFEQMGISMGLGKKYGDIGLGLVTDVSNQMWMNIARQPADRQHQVFKKYLQRYQSELQTRMAIDLQQSPLYKNAMRLIDEAEAGKPGVIDRLTEVAKQLDEEVFEAAAGKQAELYRQIEESNPRKTAAVLVDTEGALQNRVLAGKAMREDLLGTLGDIASYRIDERPLFLNPDVQHANRMRMREAAFKLADAKAARRAAALDASLNILQVAPSLYVIYDAHRKEVAGEVGAFGRAVNDEGMSLAVDLGLHYGVPMVFQRIVGYQGAALALGPIGSMAWGLANAGVSGYEAWVDHLHSSMFVEPTILPRLAGVTDDGRRIPLGDHDIITALGAPVTDDELAIPGKVKPGVFDGGRLIIARDSDGTLRYWRLQPEAEKHMSEPFEQFFERYQRGEHRLGDPDFAAIYRKTSSRTPGGMIAQHRLERIFEKLRREYSQVAGSRGDDLSRRIDTRGLDEPFRLSQPLTFEYPVSLREMFYYWLRYHEAALKSKVQFQGSTAVWREAGYESEKQLHEATLRKFLTAMATLAARDDAARKAFLEADPLALEAHLEMGTQIHFDGHTLTEQEIRSRVALLRKQALARAKSHEPVWHAYVQKYWVPWPQESKPQEVPEVAQDPGDEGGWHPPVFHLKQATRRYRDGSETKTVPIKGGRHVVEKWHPGRNLHFSAEVTLSEPPATFGFGGAAFECTVVITATATGSERFESKHTSELKRKLEFNANVHGGLLDQGDMGVVEPGKPVKMTLSGGFQVVPDYWSEGRVIDSFHNTPDATWGFHTVPQGRAVTEQSRKNNGESIRDSFFWKGKARDYSGRPIREDSARSNKLRLKFEIPFFGDVEYVYEGVIQFRKPGEPVREQPLAAGAGEGASVLAGVGDAGASPELPAYIRASGGDVVADPVKPVASVGAVADDVTATAELPAYVRASGGGGTGLGQSPGSVGAVAGNITPTAEIPAYIRASGVDATGDNPLASSAPWKHPLVQQRIDDWLRKSTPQTSSGIKLTWSDWGQPYNPANSRITGKPDSSGRDRYHYLYDISERLVSQTHGSLRQYIETGKVITSSPDPSGGPVPAANNTSSTGATGVSGNAGKNAAAGANEAGASGAAANSAAENADADPMAVMGMPDPDLEAWADKMKESMREYRRTTHPIVGKWRGKLEWHREVDGHLQPEILKQTQMAYEIVRLPGTGYHISREGHDSVTQLRQQGANTFDIEPQQVKRGDKTNTMTLSFHLEADDRLRVEMIESRAGVKTRFISRTIFTRERESRR